MLTFLFDLIDFQVHSYVDVFVHPLELERRRHQHDGHGTIERHPRRRRGRSDGETRRSAWFSKHLKFETNVLKLETNVCRVCKLRQMEDTCQCCSHVMYAVCAPSRCVQKWKTQGSTPVRFVPVHLYRRTIFSKTIIKIHFIHSQWPSRSFLHFRRQILNCPPIHQTLWCHQPTPLSI